MIWQFNAMQEPNWSEIEHAIEADTNDESLKENGFDILSSHGSEYASGMKIYRGPGCQFYVIFSENETWMDVFLPNQPSLFEFIRLYGHPYMQMNHALEIHELIEEVRHLLLDRDHGHFRKLVRDSERSREMERSRLKQKFNPPI